LLFSESCLSFGFAAIMPCEPFLHEAYGDLVDFLERLDDSHAHFTALVEMLGAAQVRAIAVLERMGYGPDNPACGA
jgi:hypothetical protein